MLCSFSLQSSVLLTCKIHFKGVRFLYNRRERQRTTPPWFTFEKKRLVEYGLI